MRKRLRRNLRVFNPPDAERQPRLPASPAELESRAVQVVRDLHALMLAAQFRTLRRSDWAVAVAENFHFQVCCTPCRRSARFSVQPNK